MFWYNGDLIKANTLSLAIDDPGLLYGATVFTTLRVYHQSLDSVLTNWAEHCDRLASSLQILGLKQPNWNRLQQGAQVLMAHFPVLRIAVFPDGREWIVGRFLPDNLTKNQKHGIKACVAAAPECQRCLPAHKTGNYLGAWLARTSAQQMLAEEAILVDDSGKWLETSTGNLWGWHDGSWWTPALEVGILPGVVRSQLKSWLLRQDMQVKEEPWLPDHVQKFEAIAYTNSVVEMIPIHTVIQAQEAKGQMTQLNYEPHHPSLNQLREFFLT